MATRFLLRWRTSARHVRHRDMFATNKVGTTHDEQLTLAFGTFNDKAGSGLRRLDRAMTAQHQAGRSRRRHPIRTRTRKTVSESIIGAYCSAPRMIGEATQRRQRSRSETDTRCG